MFSHQVHDHLQPFNADFGQLSQMKQYTASLLVKDQHLYVSCPRGGHINVWNTESASLIGQYNMRDVSGLTHFNQQVIASSGKGQISIFNNQQALADIQQNQVQGIKFDYHMTVIESA